MKSSIIKTVPSLEVMWMYMAAYEEAGMEWGGN